MWFEKDVFLVRRLKAENGLPNNRVLFLIDNAPSHAATEWRYQSKFFRTKCHLDLATCNHLDHLDQGVLDCLIL